jgi:flavin reductase (DIM6/NTAB) family NADH-FMN oxidoreductase RutF
VQFDFSQMVADDRYKLMSAAITPRPIAWVTTLSGQGVRNAAPYSFFNMMAAEPPLVALGLMRRPDGTYKDTCANLIETGEFVVNLVGEHDLDAMNFTCIDSPPGFDELEAAGVATVPSVRIAPPRIQSAPVSMECRVHHRIDVSDATTVVLGEVLVFHIDDRFVEPERLHVDASAMGLLARMHGAGWYARNPDMVQRDRPKFADYISANMQREGV